MTAALLVDVLERSWLSSVRLRACVFVRCCRWEGVGAQRTEEGRAQDAEREKKEMLACK